MLDTDAGVDVPGALRAALIHLYDPTFLRHSPLLGLFGLQDAPNPAGELRNTLETAILAMRPEEISPATSEARRHYQILFYRFVQKSTLREVASQLDISTRHVTREQARAILALQEHLATLHGVSAEVGTPAWTGPLEDGLDVGEEGLNRELAWLGDSLGEQVADLQGTIEDALRLVRDMARRHNVVIAAEVCGQLPPVAGADTVLKEIVLGLLTTAIRTVPGGQVGMAAVVHHGDVTLEVTAASHADAHQRSLGREELEMTCRLVELVRGRLAVAQYPGTLTIRAALPTIDRVTVLAIEDNLDTLRLWQRYVHRTRFRLVSTSEAERAVALAVETRPRLIVLDVMIPELDGWELLGQLRNHPVLGSIPVIVCTVLPQEELALSLGANGFVRKPTTRRAFLAALARQIAE